MIQLLPFKIGFETYALELPDIQEVVENRPIHAFPGTPAEILGAIGFHGRIVPVVNLPRLLDFPEGNHGQRLIVLTNGYGPMALATDQVRPILNVEMTHAIRMGQASERPYIKDIINWQGETISLFDLEQLQGALERVCDPQGGR